MELVTGFIDVVLHLDRYLQWLVANYGVWIYLILFLIIFCETGLVVTPFLPGDSLILYASTHVADAACPPPPDFSMGYTWALYPGYDIFVADTSGRMVRQLTNHPGYDAEATVSPTGDRIIFTSTRSGDIELYVLELDGVRLVEIPLAVVERRVAAADFEGSGVDNAAQRLFSAEEVSEREGMDCSILPCTQIPVPEALVERFQSLA